MINLKHLEATVRAYANPEALESLMTDLRYAQDLSISAFSLQRKFFIDVFGSHLQQFRICLLADSRISLQVADLTREFPKLYAWTWSPNRLMHSKCIIMPNLGVSWLGSHNLTRYSWTSALNISVRIDNQRFTRELDLYLKGRLRVATPVFPSQEPKGTT